MLPLEARKRELSPVLSRLHTLELRKLFSCARPLSNVELDDALDGTSPDVALSKLASADLVVLDAAGERVLGAYPMTTEPTEHRVVVARRELYAMCAVDALAVGAVFEAEVAIQSRCHVTGSSVRIAQRSSVLEHVVPGPGLRIGIAWQPPGECAAHSLCREMVFLRDAATAGSWRREDPERRQLLDLDEALFVGAAFFKPLLHG